VRDFRRLSAALLTVGGDPLDAQYLPPHVQLGDQELLAASRRFGGAQATVAVPAVVGEFGFLALQGPLPFGLWMTDLSVFSGTIVKWGFAPATAAPIGVPNFGTFQTFIRQFLTYTGDEIRTADIFGQFTQDPNANWACFGSTTNLAPAWWPSLISNATNTNNQMVAQASDLPIYVRPSNRDILFIVGQTVNVPLNISFAVRFVPFAG